MTPRAEVRVDDLPVLVDGPNEGELALPDRDVRFVHPPALTDWGTMGARCVDEAGVPSFGDDVWIEDERGNRAFKVDGKALRVRQTLRFEDAHGTERCQIHERMLRVKDSMEIEAPNGQRLALVKQALISPLCDRLTVTIKEGPDLEVTGNSLDHEYTIGAGRDKVAEVSKRWFRIRDTYGVEIEPGQDDVLILAVTVCIDQLAQPG